MYCIITCIQEGLVLVKDDALFVMLIQSLPDVFLVALK